MVRVFVEGVVIVGSILLAFGIDAWWEGAQDRALETEYVARLKADLIADTARHNLGVRQFETKTAVLLELSHPETLSHLPYRPRRDDASPGAHRSHGDLGGEVCFIR